MAVHDYVISNGTGAAVRSDLNGALAAIVSQNSSATEPATMYAYQWWADTTAGLLKIRNAANSAWVTIGTLASANLGLLPLAGGTMTGVLAVTAGTAALPSIAVSGDPNTGIYSPGADQVAISTGGTGRLFVTSAGLVGVGTAAPGSRLSVEAVSSDTTPLLTSLGSANGSEGAIFLRGGSTGGFYYDFKRSGTTGFLEIQGNQTSFNSICLAPTSGRVGVGTSSPGHLLDVNGTAAVGIGAANGNNYEFKVRAGTSGLSRFIAADTSDAGYIDYEHTNDAWSFKTASAEAVRIDSSQRLLVGTIASPAHQLQVSTDSAGKPSTNTWTIVSDERIKEDIELADLDLCYEAIKAIPLKRYKWRDEIYTAEQVTDRRKLGWIAQDVETVFPKAVGTHDFKYNQVFEETIIPAVEEELDADGNVITPAQPERIEQGNLISEDVIEDCRDLNADQLYAAMYGAVQKLMAKVETLEASNADLLARVAALEAA